MNRFVNLLFETGMDDDVEGATGITSPNPTKYLVMLLLLWSPDLSFWIIPLYMAMSRKNDMIICPANRTMHSSFVGARNPSKNKVKQGRLLGGQLVGEK